jgi:hypothetical protein
MNREVLKVNMINLTALITSFELADLQSILSIGVLTVSLIYTCFKFYIDFEKERKQKRKLK